MEEKKKKVEEKDCFGKFRFQPWSIRGGEQAGKGGARSMSDNPHEIRREGRMP